MSAINRPIKRVTPEMPRVRLVPGFVTLQMLHAEHIVTGYPRRLLDGEELVINAPLNDNLVGLKFAADAYALADGLSDVVLPVNWD